jgi:hypothetical protein
VNLSFLLSPSGLNFYQGIDEHCPYKVSFFKSALSGFTFFTNQNSYNLSELSNQLTHYLNLEIPETIDSFVFWATIETYIDPNEYVELIDIGKRLVQLCASEASCERVFGNLRHILTAYRTRLKEDLVAAMMTIKMNEIFGPDLVPIQVANHLLQQHIDDPAEINTVTMDDDHYHYL